MGLFDKVNLMKLKTAGENLKNKVKDAIGDELLNINKTNYTIPIDYASFPTLNATIINLSEKDVTNYKRCTINYTKVLPDEMNNYITLIENNGYKRHNNVRFDKDNTYIIMEYSDHLLTLVFHIKK